MLISVSGFRLICFGKDISNVSELIGLAVKSSLEFQFEISFQKFVLESTLTVMLFIFGIVPKAALLRVGRFTKLNKIEICYGSVAVRFNMEFSVQPVIDDGFDYF